MAGELAGAAQGAAIGTAIMPGIGTAIGAIGGALLGGWQVIMGNGNTATLDNRQDKTIRSEGPIASANPSAGGRSPYTSYYDDPMGMGGLGLDSLGLGSVPPLVWVFFFGAVAWKLSKSKK